MINNSLDKSLVPEIINSESSRPLGRLSDLVVNELPRTLAEKRPRILQQQIEELLRDRQVETSISSLSGKAKGIAILDLKIVRQALHHSSVAIPSILDESLRRIDSNTPLVLTYEDIVLNNPSSDMRTFTEGVVGKDERLFYEQHQHIEAQLDSVVSRLTEAISHLRDGAVAKANVSLSNVRQTLKGISELTGKLQSMKHFPDFRVYLNSIKVGESELKGPSGAFTAGFPILELLLRGDKVGIRAYVEKNAQYFPIAGLQKLMGDVIPNAVDGRVNLFDEWMRISNDPANSSDTEKKVALEALGATQEEMWRWLNLWRRVHMALVKGQAPEAFSGNVAGTAGEDVPAFLKSRLFPNFQWPESLRPQKSIELAPGYKVSRIVGGGWQVARGHKEKGSDEQEILDHMMSLFDSGVTTFDCGDIYTGVEELFGKFIAKVRAERGDEVAKSIRVHTKFVPDLSALPTMNKGYVERIVNRSLQRLGVEKLSMVQFHWWDYSVPGYVEAAGYLKQLQDEGKIEHIGLTNFDVERTREIVESGVTIASNQIQYSLLDRRPEHGMIELAQKHGFKLLCYGSLAGGFLTERYLGVPAPQEPFENRSLVKYRLIIDECGGWESFQSLLSTLKRVADRHKVRIEDIAVRYVLDQPSVASAIVGMSTRRSASSLQNVYSFMLSDEDKKQIRDTLSEMREVPGDIYDLERDPRTQHFAIMKRELNN